MGDSTTRRVVAAAYARFSSDSQRDESIEIQLREIGRLVEREGWELGESYCDHAISGRTDERPAFRRCIADGEAGAYDVLVIYKLDRLARNVSVAQQAKRRLFDAGRRLVSVREGEITDTPDGFLMSSIGDIFAEYYSRNLAVLVRGGIDQAARDLRAAGRRIYGYSVDETDHFRVDESQAGFVRGIFSRYLAGESMGQIAGWLNGAGSRTIRGNRWSVAALAAMIPPPLVRRTFFAPCADALLLAATVEDLPGDFAELVKERERIAPTAFGNLVALPHPMRAVSARTFVAVGLLDEPVTWAGHEVWGVFLISLATERDLDLSAFYHTLLRVLMDTDAVRELLEDRRFETLLALVRRQQRREVGSV